jgi:NAD(P)-dependent dehydrogenase (short-subunit alcohol dehydrogenase family)
VGELDGKAALVTGGASGIGRAAAVALAAEGAAVAVVDIDPDGAQSAVAEIEGAGGRAVALVADLGNAARVLSLVPEAVASLGRVDILVNCAGIHPLGGPTLLELDGATWDRVCAVNLKAPFLLTREFARHAIERGGGGRIVNLSSSGAYRAGSDAAYASTKTAIVGLTRSAAGQLAQYGVNANAVAPGLTRTPMALAVFGSDEELDRRAEGANLFGRTSEPEEVAAVILFLCLPASSQITAQVIHTSAGQIV